MTRPVRSICIVLAAVLLTGGVAHAHKLKLFATGEGREISGYVYFPGWGRAVDLPVEALAPDGTKLGQAMTNAEGEFTIPVTHRCDHTLIAETSDGHKATFLVEGLDLVDDLPAFGSTPLDEAPPTPAAEAPPAANDGTETAQIEREQVLSAIDDAVRKQVRPLREQIEQYEERRHLHDVLGGIGYIVGVAGIAFYFLGVRRREAGGAGTPKD